MLLRLFLQSIPETERAKTIRIPNKEREVFIKRNESIDFVLSFSDPLKIVDPTLEIILNTIGKNYRKIF